MECPNASESCKYWESKHGCRTNIHHEFYPACDYTTPIQKEFRELPENKEALCMYEHELKHRTETPPEMPTRDEMLMVINGIRKAL